MNFWQGSLFKKLDVSSLFMTHRLYMIKSTVKFHEYTPCSLECHAQTLVKSYGPHTIQQDLFPDRIARLILHILFLENSKSMTLILT